MDLVVLVKMVLIHHLYGLPSLRRTADEVYLNSVYRSHKRKFAYEAHTACDANGFVLETVVTPRNVHDNVAFDDVYEKVTEAFSEIKRLLRIPPISRPISAKSPCAMSRPTGSTGATPKSVPIARPASCIPIPKTASRRCSGTSGRTTRNWRTTPVIRSTEALLRGPTG